MKFKDYIENKSWKNDLDEKLPFDTIKKINGIKSIEVVSTCEGHPKNTGIIFRLKRFNGKTFNEIKDFYDNLVKNINSENNDCKWICWIEPNSFFYDSKSGYNENIIKLRGKIEPLKNQIPVKTLINITNPSGKHDPNFINWWKNIYKILSKI